MPDEEYQVNRYAIYLCDGCMDAIGEECHAPGCAMWLNRAPDLSLRNNPMLEKLDPAIANQPHSELVSKVRELIQTAPYVPSTAVRKLGIELEAILGAIDCCTGAK